MSFFKALLYVTVIIIWHSLLIIIESRGFVSLELFTFLWWLDSVIVLGLVYKFNLQSIKGILCLKVKSQRGEEILASFLLFVLINIVLIMMVYPIAIRYYNTTIGEGIQLNNQANMFYIVSLLALAPFFEELIFRRVFAHELYKRYGFIKSILMSSTLFTLVHVFSNDPCDFFVLFFEGVLLAYIYLKTRNVYLVMIIHFFWNLNTHLTQEGNFVVNILNKYRQFNNFWEYYILVFIFCIIMCYFSNSYLNKYHAKYINK